MLDLDRFSLLVLTVKSKSQGVGKGQLQATGIRSIDDNSESVLTNVYIKKGSVIRKLTFQS